MKNAMNQKGTIIITRAELEALKAQSFKEGYEKAKKEQREAEATPKKAKGKVTVNGEKKEFRATVKEETAE